ncbi:zona pellucida glycoprotein 3f, tandem duplicate 1 [Electrophorus electricus]|uniref:zona pellucida glycoprotein 3f, tandem duplicate 1 n=1 Tax=Electrophorus electricus TaxID=8005 RepID=UPI0015D03EE9|nr:zona pellucida glycoprotein 3f, tandem duplicate 1 [Electrophorus electricus]
MDTPDVTVNPGGSEAIFHIGFDACSFRRLVTEDDVVFENELTSLASSKVSSVLSPVVCVYEKPADWSPPLYDPVIFHTNGQGNLLFHLNLMNDDFSGVALSTTFSLGSFIPIAATVDQASHQPLILLLEECVASTTPTLAQDGHIHPIITNNGCLMDSKNTNSRFLPRRSLSEIRLYLQAFKFTNAEKVYIHCKLVAWDPHVMDSGKKACQYDAQKGRWVLLDDPRKSALCTCCETRCQARRQRGIGKGQYF